MSIRILPDSEIKAAASSFHAPALLFANPKNLYQRRIARFTSLSNAHPLEDYLHFASQVAEAQLAVLQQQPIAQDPRLSAEKLSAEDLAKQPLNAQRWQRDPVWQTLLMAILAEMKPKANETILNTIETLEKYSKAERDSIADKLLAQEFEQISSDQAVFIWAALSLYWLQLVQQIPHSSHKESGDNLHVCPICASAPVTSVIHFGAEQGLRYLHCALCETEWNMVRSKCTNCDQTGKLDYWSLDSEMAAVKAESCGDCHSYLKALYQERDPKVEAVADDLASIFLDVEMEEKGLQRSGLNPFLFPNPEA
ncbi:formate dehydrogenase accessory protein FdhE [Pasteurella multocida]|uniref:formate dehydrogenase accessory protein FdhE n=1 Tax=Pasteurella multocida TaxID=747 RepID=UPI00147D9ACF|nr:formate dehydrogenase accessory protein FdhE [Pasteurella multocida]NNI31237.1 formate dehydrogenase accessory protein FdhE [Pasteurella multocida]NNI61620.1 formate dehydrogenase accessory protein FdhE [Pasteurella multocida]WRK04055.1 formate dehydrogenase accessory protein FdhE [Pasteurella multocida]HDR1496449.1 formate dehydrogenase accessory protein FdhE [Pasteurella multocida]HEA3290030.1 formate dehydrogenase accessory protein FdhE [Pasteurella multocida]